MAGISNVRAQPRRAATYGGPYDKAQGVPDEAHQNGGSKPPPYINNAERCY